MKLRQAKKIIRKISKGKKYRQTTLEVALRRNQKGARRVHV